MLRARRGDGENNHPVPLLRTPTPQKLSLSCPHSEGGHNYRVSRLAATLPTESGSPPAPRKEGGQEAKVLPEPPGALTTWRRSPFYLYLLREPLGSARPAFERATVERAAEWVAPVDGSSAAATLRVAAAAGADSRCSLGARHLHQP